MLLAFDLDSTIVTTDQRLPENIREAIFAARQAGHFVTVLTGRTEASAKKYLDLLEVSGFYGVNHGATVVDGAREIMRHVALDGDIVRDLLARYQGTPGLEISCTVQDRLYVRNPEDERWKWAHTINHELLSVDAYADEPAEKVVYSCERGAAEMYRELYSVLPHLMYYLWEDQFLEVTADSAHKGAALELLARTLGFRREETIAFGDGVNDVTMIEWAGRGVAVGRAHKDVLAAADEHIAAPEEEGVAAWLEANLCSAMLPKAQRAAFAQPDESYH
jgi:5-amino-6-(5-phospho-D-ribitylamino)uracil phosphatase